MLITELGREVRCHQLVFAKERHYLDNYWLYHHHYGFIFHFSVDLLFI